MWWSMVGFSASLIPVAIVALTAVDAVRLPCYGPEAASLKCLWCVAATVAVLASVVGLRRRVAVALAAAGLALGVAAGCHLALSEPAMSASVGIPTVAVVSVIRQWR